MKLPCFVKYDENIYNISFKNIQIFFKIEFICVRGIFFICSNFPTFLRYKVSFKRYYF